MTAAVMITMMTTTTMSSTRDIPFFMADPPIEIYLYGYVHFAYV